MKNFLTGFIFGAIAFSAVLGFSQGRYDFLRVYAQVFNLVEEHYIEKLNSEKLVQYSIRGLLGSLDSYSGYLPKKDYKEFKNESNGGFSGIGVELSLKNRSLQVISVVEDAPAWKAGVLPQDKIVEINGKKIYALDFTEATKELKGKNGKKIQLKIKRPGLDELINFNLRRKKITINPVRIVLNNQGILVVRLTGFTTGTAKSFKKLVEKEKFETLLLDMRNNPGGLLSEAVDLVDFFAEAGVIVKTVSRAKNDEVSFAQKENTIFKDKKVYILVDGASASASEIVASSMRDLKGAKIFGKKTYGKGSVQSVVPLPEDQGGVKLTIARYYTQSEKMIDKKGVLPDVEWPEKGVSTLPVKDTAKDKLLQWSLKQIKN